MEDDRKRTRLRKSLQLYLSRTLKKIPPIHIPSSAIPANITSARHLATCRCPRTPSLDLDAGDHAATAGADDNSNSKDQAATLSDVDRFLFDNFRSLYIHDENNDPSSSAGTSTSVVDGTPPAAETSSSSSSEASEDVKKVRPGEAEEGGDSGCRRSLCRQPASWLSAKPSLPTKTLLTDLCRQPASRTVGEGFTDSKKAFADCLDLDPVVIVVFSMDPYTDFRRSMQNMIKMHHGCLCQPLDWEFLEELLFFYLQLNDKVVHKHILKAFADLTAGTHMVSSTPGNAQWADKSRSQKNH